MIMANNVLINKTSILWRLGGRMDFQLLAQVMRDLALQAGAAIMQVYDSADMGVRAKSDHSPITQADEAANDIISAGLAHAFPALPLITEEDGGSHRLSAKTFLIVDPLDGTKEFVQRRGDFTVNIAYVENGMPLRGCVYAPAKRRLFYTMAQGQSVEEMGPHVVGRLGQTRDISVNPAPDNNALMVVASKSHRDAATDDYIARYHVRDMTSAGSSLKLCLIATGEADLYPRLGRTMEWDTAAGDAVLRGAGGQVLYFDTHKPLDYGKKGWENPHFIARAPKVQLL
jgi:3'(2'), 5'-bisphosphate nucleotidase